MTSFDLVLIAVILAGGVWGLMAGASRISVPFVLVIVGATIVSAYPRVATLFKGPDPVVQGFMYLLLFFIGLIICGFLLRIIRNAVATTGLGPLDKIAGLAIGLITGALIAGSLIWGIETYGDGKWQSLMKSSEIAPSALAFFNIIMTFTDRLFPRPEAPWWKRPLW